jgi:aerobic-type carbon monoxide dehydrogenase small subunit (CoxS/CutS family)
MAFAVPAKSWWMDKSCAGVSHWPFKLMAKMYKPLQELQAAFLEHNAFQCGFCSSGMLLTALEITKHHKQATREEIRELISGNYCRCTGYQAIVNAIESVLVKSSSASGVKV